MKSAIALVVFLVVSTQAHSQLDFSSRTERDIIGGENYSSLNVGHSINPKLYSNISAEQQDTDNQLTTNIGISLQRLLFSINNLNVNIVGGISTRTVNNGHVMDFSYIQKSVGLEFELRQSHNQSYVVSIMNKFATASSKLVNPTLSFGVRFYF